MTEITTENVIDHLNIVRDSIRNLLIEAKQKKLPSHACMKMLYFISRSAILEIEGPQTLDTIDQEFPEFHQFLLRIREREPLNAVNPEKDLK